MHVARPHAPFPRAPIPAPGRRIVLRWMPTFLGFPIGGFVAEIVGRVDAVAPAIVGGAITGAVLGFAQWLGMRRSGPPPLRVDPGHRSRLRRRTRRSAPPPSATTPAPVRWPSKARSVASPSARHKPSVLRRTLGRIVLAWPPVVAALWALGWIVTASSGIDVGVAVHRLRLQRRARRHRRHIGAGDRARPSTGRARLRASVFEDLVGLAVDAFLFLLREVARLPLLCSP